jgi:hypothetical protein
MIAGRARGSLIAASASRACCLRIVGGRLLREALFGAPRGQLELRVGRVRSAGAAVKVFADERTSGRIALVVALQVFGPLPFAVVGHQSGEPAGQHVRGVISDREGELLDTLGRKAVFFAPESQPDVSVGVFARLGVGPLVGSAIGRGRRRCGRFSIVANHRKAEEDDVHHERAPGCRWKSEQRISARWVANSTPV